MKNVLITGASKGIGAATAIKFANEKYNVIINYNKNKVLAEELAKKIGGYAIQADVSNKSEVDKMYFEIVNKFGSVDVLVNNAGIALPQKTILDVTEKEFDSVFAVDVKGVFNCTVPAVKLMLNNGGMIINVSSIWGLLPASCEVVYSTAKSAVIGFTKSLAEELSFTNIKVYAVAPALINTDMNVHLSEKDKADFLKEIGEKEIGQPEDVANVIFSLTVETNVLESGSVVKVCSGKL